MKSYPSKPVVAVGAIVFKQDEVLLIRRGKEPNKGQWSLPGGRQELGETIAETAVREVAEETAVDVRPACLVDVVDSITKDETGRITYHYTLVELMCLWEGGAPVANDDALDAQWFSLDDLSGLGLWSETEKNIQKAWGLRKNKQSKP